MRAFLVTCLLFLAALGPARAQEAEFYVQIEALRSLAQAESRAEAYAGLLPDVNGFRLGGGWHALSLGPYREAEAQRQLRALLAEGLIPRDSYLSDGRTYRDRFFPVGGQAARPLAPRVEVPALPASEVEETPREAARSEGRLTRGEREDLQRALAWFGFYDAGIDGSFGRGTRASMAAWQRDAGLDPTGVLTTRQRAALLEAWREAQAALGLAEVSEGGVALTAPLGLVAFDRIEAPFVHFEPRDGSGVRLALISQPGDAAALAGLYEIMQTLDAVPLEGPRQRRPGGFSIAGAGQGRAAQVEARLEDGHIFGYLLSWPEMEAASAARAVEAMSASLRRAGAPLDPQAGFVPEAQEFDMVSGLERRKPLRAGAGIWVDGAGRVATAAANVEGCGRVTLDARHDGQVVLVSDGIAVIEPLERLAPPEVARLAGREGRLRSAVSVGGFPFGGVLGAATLSFGTLDDVRGLDGSRDVLRLGVTVSEGDIGGPVLDMGGRVAGILVPASVPDSVALPEDVAFAAKSRVLARVLAEAGVTAETAEDGPAIAPEDLTARAAAVTVLVSCWE